MLFYAPTWTDKAFNTSWKRFRMALCASVPETINLIVKPHPNLVRYRRDEAEEFENALKRHKNAQFLGPTSDIVRLMAASDLLIGDVSAVTREFLALKRPFVFLSCKPRWMWSRRKKTLWECGEVVTRPQKLWPTVMRSLENPEKHRDAIEKHFRTTFYKPDGKAAQRAAEAIRSIIA